MTTLPEYCFLTNNLIPAYADTSTNTHLANVVVAYVPSKLIWLNVAFPDGIDNDVPQPFNMSAIALPTFENIPSAGTRLSELLAW